MQYDDFAIKIDVYSRRGETTKWVHDISGRQPRGTFGFYEVACRSEPIRQHARHPLSPLMIAALDADVGFGEMLLYSHSRCEAKGIC